MKRKLIFVPVLLLALLATPKVEAQVSIPPGLLPSDRNADWNPGMVTVGGIPNRTTVCATLSPGGGEDSGRINSAISACPAGQVVQLSAGTFLTNDHVLINKGITLRGAGPGQTTLFSGGDGNEPNIIVATARFGGGPYNHVNLTSDAQMHTNSVTVASTAGFSPGQYVLVSEDQFSNDVAQWNPLPPVVGQASNNATEVWQGDRVSFQKRNPSTSGDDPFPDSLGWFARGDGHVLGEVKEIASISGNTITFTTPFHITYRTNHHAQVSPYGNSFVTFAGVEDLTMEGGSEGCLTFSQTAKSWAKHVECKRWHGRGIKVYNSFKNEIRDSYIHDTISPRPGGVGYAMDLGGYSAEVLFENNIMFFANKVMTANAGGAGSVVAYNYTDDGLIDYNMEWQEVGVNGSHYAGSHHILFEGNYSFNGDSDHEHGGSIYHTFFRNHFSGFRKDLPNNSSMRTAGSSFGTYWFSWIGNVLGTPGRMAGWSYDYGAIGNGSPGYIWRLGYYNADWGRSADPKVLSTIWRGGNFDYLTNQVQWHNITQQTLPNSFYLTSKPGFFGNCTWPWVDPIGGTKTFTLPAKARFDAGQPNTIGVGGCGGTTPPPPPPPPAGLSADLNQDHIVNTLDWAIMSSQWLTNNTQADINKDGLVNSLDFAVMSSQWLRTW
jgi:hypothetical protein